MNRYIILGMLIILSRKGFPQYVGVGTTSPQATLDVKGNQRLGGVAHFMTFDSLGGKIEWRGANLYVPVSQYLIQHSAAADGLFYNNTAPISGQLEYRNELGNPVFFTNFLNGNGYFKSNLGIGNSTPKFPLSFNGTLGDKISLWTDGTSTHYGFGIQPGLLQMFSKTDVDDIAFGYGSSSLFTEAMRIKGNGNVGIGNNNPTLRLDITGRMRIRTGLDGEAGIWLNNNNNTGVQGFMGLENDTYLGLYGAGGSGWSFGMNTINGDIKMSGRLGIGTTTPNAPLSFPPALGKKITLYPGTTGDVGMAVQGNLLQIYSDNPNADIALGYDQGGVFTERFRVKANGSLMINGNAGNPGQLIQSTGSGTAPVWVDPPPKVQYYRTAINNTLLTDASSRLDIPVPVTVYANSIITVSVTVDAITANFFGCDHGQLSISFEPLNGGGLFSTAGRFETPCGRPNTIATGEHTLLASNGTSKVFTAGTAGVLVGFVKTSPNGSPDIRIGNSTPAVIIVKVIPL
ncbi:MAG: hypothetical protein ACKVOW_10410 [Chitinophagaceae bacterium]